MTTTPDQILNALAPVSATSRTRDLSAVHALIDDVRSSYQLALKAHPALTENDIHSINVEIDDYIANHYGDDGIAGSHICDRCGGVWGYDLTCADCTTESGAVRPLPTKASL